MLSKFKPYNKSMLVNVFMSEDYKEIWNTNYIPNYDYINKKINYVWTALMNACWNNDMINITRLLLSEPDIDVNIKREWIIIILHFYKYRIQVRKKNNELIKVLQAYI